MLENRSSADSHVTAYRPDLDGLRAVAVISVIAYHMARSALPGGYLGVDIFFVLSGYLITSIIWREAILGSFSIVTFYNRRIRRIMPALLLVIVATTGAAAWLLLPVDLVGMGRSILAALAFAANFYFWRDTDYFSRLAEEKPLLHIWSLGVEEQFYLLFPLLLIGVLRASRRHTRAVIGLLVLLSLAANFAALQVGGALPAFYLLPTRAWELGVGALLAITPSAAGRSQIGSAGAGAAGLALIAVSLAAGRTLFPASVPDALAIVAGTALVIWAGTGGGSLVNRILSWRGLVFVGLISYSLYLWHWPVIVLLKYYLVRELTAFEMAMAAGVMVGCAVVSWRYVERPFRSKETPIRTVYLTVVTGTVLAAAIAVALIGSNGLPGRLDADAARINASVGTNHRCPISDYVHFSGSRGCLLNLPSRDPATADLVLFGNSHAQMYAPLIEDILVSQSQQGLLVPMNSCTPTTGVNVNQECRELAERNLDAIARLPRARAVVLATTWPPSGTSAPNTQALTAGLDRTIERLTGAGKKVVLVGPLAGPGWNVASELSRSLAFRRPQTKPLFQPRPTFMQAHAAALAHFAGRSDVELIRPDIIQCPADRCEYLMEGRSLFADSTHLAAPELPRFRALFEAPLARALAN